MGSLAGAFQRPIFAAAAVAVASVSTDLPNKLSNSKSSDASLASEALKSQAYDGPPSSEYSCASHISVSKLARLSFVTRIQVPVPNVNHHPMPNPSFGFVGNHVESSSRFVKLYQSAELSKAWKPKTCSYSSESVPSEDLYRWHLPEPSVVDVAGKSNCSSAKSRTVVVLLGWLGAKQKHLKKYAEWYTSRGFHVITFTFPMYEVLSYKVGGKAEQDVKFLVNHLADWVEEEHDKNLMFHTFSNTGWLTYGAVLEKFQKQDPSLGDKIKGCIVDSAPVASADPQVWASGFSAAFLKKQSVAMKGLIASCDIAKEGSIVARTVNEAKPAVTESALLVLLEKFFEVVLKLPPVNRRLTDVMGLLSWKQPSCPQLYIYSSSDRVIPASSVESFIEQQRKSGHEVRSCNFVSTPHVDHFRHNPHLYTSQLTHFLEDCVLKCCKGYLSTEPN